MDAKEVINRIFKDPKTKYELTEFENLGRPIEEILEIYPKVIESGREAGKTKYFVKSIVPSSSGKEEYQIYSEGKKSNPEEIVRQLWIYKLVNVYGYHVDEIDIEKSVQFGTEVFAKAADIVVYTDNTKQTPKIIIEVKKPKRKDGIAQLKSYLNAEGSPVGVWSNGSDSIILYRPYPKDFDDTLFDIPRRGQEPSDVLEAKKTLLQLRKDFNFKKIIQDLEELVLADSGADEFNEIFKLIFAKIWDEKEAQENRKDKVVEFRKALDPEITYDRINKLFHKACEEWPGIFREGEDIELRQSHLQVCVGPIEGVRLLGSNLRVMDDAFEYLLPMEAKKKKGQFFTPRHVVEMCVRMLNPKPNEFVMDPACGSGGFLLHTMEWCYPATTEDERELRKHRYAAKYLYGIDFELRAAKTSRALMLIAGDGHSNIFGPDVSSLDPRTWYETLSGQTLMKNLIESHLIAKRLSREDEARVLRDVDLAWEYFDNLRFDVILANPPFAGEMKDKRMLAHYELAKPAMKRAKNKAAKEERDVLFIERILKFLKPGGRAAIVLPQGKFNNSSLAFIREWILRKARLLAVVGLHQNTFKPHTGTKTSVLFIQKYTEKEIQDINNVKQQVAADCPDFEVEIRTLLENHANAVEVPEEELSGEITEALLENFADVEPELFEITDDEEAIEDEDQETLELDELIEIADEHIQGLHNELLQTKNKYEDLDIALEAVNAKRDQEIAMLSEHWEGLKKDLNAQIREIRTTYREETIKLKDAQKDPKKKLQTQIKSLEKALDDAKYEKKLLTNKGKLELLLADEEIIASMKERWIDAEVAKQLDYPIFMAVSEHGGKSNSGDYEYLVDEDGNLIEYGPGHTQEGQIAIDQDLVNYFIDHNDILDTKDIPQSDFCIAEAFIEFAQKNGFSFWVGE